MTRIESEKIHIEKTSEEIFGFLCNLNNYKQLMPEQVSEWSSSDDECSFTIQGMTTLGMSFSQKIPNRQITLADKGKVPFSFNIHCFIEETGTSTSLLQLVMEADLNPFLKMMAEKPLTNFLNLLIRKYAGIGQEQ